MFTSHCSEVFWRHHGHRNRSGDKLTSSSTSGYLFSYESVGRLVLMIFISAPSFGGTHSITHGVSGTVNGQPVSATAMGSGDSETGIYTLDWNFAAIPAGYSVWGTVVTQAGLIGSNLAQTVPPAVNLLTLSGGDYSVHEEAAFEGGGIIIYDTVIETSGNSITGSSTLSGNVNLPPLVGLTMPSTLWTAGPASNQLTETVVKSLIRQDGGPPIRVKSVAVYTLAAGVSLLQAQHRELALQVEQAQPNVTFPSTATIRYESLVRPTGPVPAVSSLGVTVLAICVLGIALKILMPRCRAT